MSRTIPRPSEAVAAAAPAEDVPYPLAKRVFDRTVAALLLVVLSPLLGLAFVILAGDMLFVPRDRGRWLYRERRISRGREFEVLKFRVLREDVLAEIASQRGRLRAPVRGRPRQPDRRRAGSSSGSTPTSCHRSSTSSAATSASSARGRGR